VSRLDTVQIIGVVAIGVGATIAAFFTYAMDNPTWFKEVEHVWKKSWLGCVLIAISSLVSLGFIWHTPPSGFAVVAMAVVAGIMAIRQEMGGWERHLWFVVLMLFAIAEMRAISHDRERANAEFQHTTDSLMTTIDQGKTAIAEGKAAIDGLQTVIKEGRQHFDQTMEGVAGSVKTQTGGESFATFSWVPGQGFLIFIHKGNYPLYGVTARIVDLDRDKTERDLLGITVNLGDMEKGHGITKDEFPNMAYAASRVGKFNANVFFLARNGGWTEKFRAQKTKDGWARAIHISGEFTTLRKSKPLCETIDKHFPLDLQGQVEKDWVSNSKLPSCQ